MTTSPPAPAAGAPDAAERVLTAAVTSAAKTLEDSSFAQSAKPESRLRLAIRAALERDPQVVGIQQEWHREMPGWPWRGAAKLGGFDLAITLAGEGAPAVVCELKWCDRIGIDAFDEVMWDLFKLAHARETLPKIKAALLIYAVRSAAWNAEKRFRDVFSTTTLSPRHLIDHHRPEWRWLLSTSSKSRPTRLPAAIKTRRVVRVPFVRAGEHWDITVVSVACAGEAWFELTPEGWPA